LNTSCVGGISGSCLGVLVVLIETRRGQATAYLIRRTGTSVVILIGISIFVYVLLHSVFPSPAIVILGPKASPAGIAAFNAQNGYDRPVIEQYLHYVNGLLHGNLGYSYKLNQSVGRCSASGGSAARTCPEWAS
jgi:hypothetical protein